MDKIKMWACNHLLDMVGFRIDRALIGPTVEMREHIHIAQELLGAYQDAIAKTLQEGEISMTNTLVQPHSWEQELEVQAVNRLAKQIGDKAGDPNWWNHVEAAKDQRVKGMNSNPAIEATFRVGYTLGHDHGYGYAKGSPHAPDAKIGVEIAWASFAISKDTSNTAAGSREQAAKRLRAYVEWADAEEVRKCPGIAAADVRALLEAAGFDQQDTAA